MLDKWQTNSLVICSRFVNNRQLFMVHQSSYIPLVRAGKMVSSSLPMRLDVIVNLITICSIPFSIA